MRKIVTLLLLVTLLISPAYAFAADEHDHGHGDEKEHGGHGEKDEHGHGDEHEEAGPTQLSEEDLKRFGITLEDAKSGTIIDGVSVAGRIVPVDEKLAHVSPRFSGVIKEVRAKVGDSVKADTLLAVIQNNQNLQSFSLYPSIAGTVIKRHATLGETVREEDVIFIVADLSEVWAELAVYKQDVDKVSVGQKAIVSIASHMKPIEGEVIFFSPITEEKTQSRLARIRIKNPDPHFSPGAFVSGRIVTSKDEVPLVIESSAIQRIESKDTVFVREGETFQPRSVVLGRSDERGTEILSGLTLGERYAAGNTFVLKADLGKSEAEHEH
jgi:cobalt-zinc-cadmium efflux system membrane fusion protein